MKVAVACGGTGGHLFPGLSVARALEKRGHKVVLWLGGRDVESNILDENWAGDVVRIRSVGFPSRPTFKSALAAGRLGISVLQSFRRMRKNRPDILLAMGSYASVGPVLAAAQLGVPVILHEANAVPGRAVSFLSRFSKVVALGFECARKWFPKNEVIVTGMPIRVEVLDNRKPAEGLLPGVFSVLVTGGSQGAHRLNELASEAICLLHDRGVRLQVLHLAGTADAEATRALYRERGVLHSVHAFLQEMGQAYHGVDLAITRAGAATCAELCYCRVPSIMVPLPNAPRDHQTANATAMAARGGAMVVQESDVDAGKLADMLQDITDDGARLDSMRKQLACAEMERPAERLADLVERAASTG